MAISKEAKLWQGIEVEGRLLGLKTLFVADIDCEWEKHLLDFEHIFLGCLLLIDEFVMVANEALALNKLVTIEIEVERLPQLPAYLINKCHIMAFTKIDNLCDFLKPSDTWRVNFGDHDIGTITFNQFQRTRPTDYQGDEEL